MADPNTTSPRAGTAPVPLASSAARPGLAARERVADLLQVRFAEDCLTLDEFERRVAVAYQANTMAELDGVVADLADPAQSPSVPATGKVVAILSNNERSGAMSVPSRLEIVAVLGNVEMDLSDATLGTGVTEIEISAVFGNVELTVPMGVRVECAGNAFLGSFDHKPVTVTGYASDAGRIIRITGHAVFSSVEIGSAPPRLQPNPGDSPRRLA